MGRNRDIVFSDKWFESNIRKNTPQLYYMRGKLFAYVRKSY